MDGLIVFILLSALIQSIDCQCTASYTTVSGTHAPTRSFCSGDLIFEDNFDSLDYTKWKHENTLAGGGNWEFQWYVNDRLNSYTFGGVLHFKPTLTSDIFGEKFLTTARVQIDPEKCTQPDWNGCDRQGTPDNEIINPIRSARVSTWDSFRFKYGTLEIRAKVPTGDWLWPALWMMPAFENYGGWPRSGEIDLMELRGNRELYDGDVNVGVEQVGSTLHYGPDWTLNGWPKAHQNKNKVNPNYGEDFHLYKVTWTPESLEFFYDNEIVGTIEAGDGFWARGEFEGKGWDNPWTGGTIMAPFDQEFYIIMNLAVGGTNFFADSFENRNNPKPWSNTSPRAAADFWQARTAWEPTWNRNTNDSHLQVDYVRVWAL